MNTSIALSLDMRRSRADNTYPIILRLSHKRQTIAISSGYAVKEEHWDDKARRIRKSCTYIENITRVNNILEKTKAKAVDAITRLEERGELALLSAKELKDMLTDTDQTAGFFVYVQNLVDELHRQKRVGTAEYYRNVLREVKNFRDGRDFTLEELSYAFLMKFESYYLAKGLERNGLNVYMRGLKAICNRAIKDRLIERDKYPFINYKIIAKPTRKRAIDLEAINRVVALDLDPDSKLFEARAMFLFSFYTMGMPFVDMAFLKAENIVDGRIQYGRKKTGKQFDIKVSDSLKPILAYFMQGKNAGDFLMPIITAATLTGQYKNVRDVRKRYNARLEKLAEQAGIEEKLTSYVSRHSFATLADNMAIPVTAISQMLGHLKLSTTQVYLAGLKKDVLDDYNERILTGK